MRHLFRVLLLFLCSFLMLSEAVAQRGSATISGTVWDKVYGETLIGATIQVKGTNQGAVTNMEGVFTLQEVKLPATLLVSYIGYKSLELTVTSPATSLRIELEEDAQNLSDLVVLGYGAESRKEDLSAAVGIISNADKLAVRPVSSPTAMLQGQIPGVTIQSNGGDPTNIPNIVIRGQGSQNGDNVLWVVDGVPGAPITSVNEIESIVVLKDAASAAIYGAQSGAGGVILVTTKKASKGEPNLSYDGTVGIRQAANLPRGLNAEEQLRMRTLSFKNAGMTIPDSWNPEKNPWIATTRTNWMDEIFRTALYHRHNIALNVGGERSVNRFTFSYDDNQGVLINTFNKSFAFRYNGSFDINRYLTIKEDLIWTNHSSKSKNTNDGYTGPILSAIYMPSSAEVYNPIDGSFGGVTTEDPEYIKRYGSDKGSAHGDVVNPVRLLLAENRFSKSNDLWSTTTLSISNVVPGLKYNVRFSYNLFNSYYKGFSPRIDEPGKPNDNNYLGETASRAHAWNLENTLTYDNSFGKHSVGALLSTTADYWVSRGVKGEGKDFADEDKSLQYMGNAEKTSADDWLYGPDANLSYVARLSYSYDDRYFATASWRRDYAGRLPKSNNYGDFPAMTAAWKLSNEPFFTKSETLSLLKLRASWGRIGNLGSVGLNYRYPTLSDTYWDQGAHYGAEVDHQYNTFYYFDEVINPKLSWETSEQLDLGFDLVMFRERLSLAVDYFNKRTFNLIQRQTLGWPSTIGLSAPLVNEGEVRNRGVEFSLNWSDHPTKDFSYFVSSNITYLKNWVSDIGVENSDGSKGVWANKESQFRSIPYMMQTAEGQPIGSFYLIKTDGIFQSDEEAANYTHNGKRIQPNAVAGDLKFVDYNNDGVIDDQDRQYLGNAMPDFTYALSFGATYRNLSLSLMLQGVQGAQALHVAKFVTMSDVEGNFNRDSRILDAWSPTNRGSNIPRISKNDPNDNFARATDWYLEDASYLRIKNVTLSYDLTDTIRNWSHLEERKSSLSLYLSGENLWTFTKYSGMDPETGGWDAMNYPVSRVISFGIKMTY